MTFSKAIIDEGAKGILGPAQVRELAQKIGVSPTKKLGQNFVHDPGTVRKIVRAAGVGPKDTVVEIGPGLGSLTLALLEADALVSAVEIDKTLAAALPNTVAERMPDKNDNFALVNLDALAVTGPQDIAVPPQLMSKNSDSFRPTFLVANLPYNVSVPVLLHFLQTFTSLKQVLVMVQMEVANRLAAAPGSRTYGVPSVKANWYGKVERAGSVGRAVFWPIPNVDSALVRIERYDKPLGSEAERQGVFELVDAAFAQRRKTLRAALTNWAGSSANCQLVLDKAGVDAGARGETLDVHDFLAIYRASLQIKAAGKE